jgi:non-specific serine/threonine protein kinase
MKPDRFARLKGILAEVAALSEDEREAYLDEACKGDPELRKEVESILAKDTKTHRILKTGGAIPLNSEDPTGSSDMTGQILSHFRIEEKIASGGMGVLYKASDLKLDRNVAIKVLRPDLLSHPDIRQRFVREAKAASALNHPGIVTVHEIDADSGIDFIAMEYVEGQTLDEMITPEGLPIESITDYALEMAEALRVAHKKGIIHRDLKPSNVMITEGGKTKILDFGIAKRLYPAPGDGTETPPETQITQAGGVIGTLRYLSPEQASGEVVDHRTDIWSLGVMLYEMVTGQLPFVGGDKTAVIGAILKETPAPVSEYRSDVPAVLEEIVEKCMEKSKAERYQGAGELASDLHELRQAIATGTTVGQPLATKTRRDSFVRRWPWVLAIAAVAILVAGVLLRNFTPFGEPPAPERKMLVVLPFENLGPPEDEYFADGITEELMARLASISELGVIARTSAMKYKETDKTIHQIGEELGVEYVLEGTIRWQRMAEGESRVRVTPQLIRVSDEIHLWADVYENDMMDIFQVQSEIATQVAENALAYAALSRSHYHLYHLYYDHTEECISHAREAAERALELGPNLPESHLAMGRYHYTLKEYDKALEEYRIASKLRPNDSDVLGLGAVAMVLRRRGEFEAAAEEMEKAFELNPLNVDLLRNLGGTYRYLRNFQKADSCFNRIISLEPDFAGAYSSKAWNYINWNGDIEKARAILEQAPAGPRWKAFDLHYFDYYERKYQSALDQLRLTPESVFESQSNFVPKTLYIAINYNLLKQSELAQVFFDSTRIFLESELEERPDDHRIYHNLGLAYAGLGLKEEAIRMGETAVQMMPNSRDALTGTTPLRDLARIYTMVGEYDSAIGQIEYLLSIPSQISVPRLRISPTWDPLRDHPRFQKLIAEETQDSP